MPLGFIGPLKKENEALRKEIGDLREEIASLKVKQENFNPFTGETDAAEDDEEMPWRHPRAHPTPWDGLPPAGFLH